MVLLLILSKSPFNDQHGATVLKLTPDASTGKESISVFLAYW
jgi:hypothetical protein